MRTALAKGLGTIFVAVVVAEGAACNETKISRYDTIAEARADRLFERGWVPDVLPFEGGPVREIHDIDSSSRCAQARFQ